MKKTHLKFLFSIMLIFTFFVLTTTYFCATATKTHEYYFEKPDSWTGNKVYINLLDSNTNTKAFPDPGAEIPKILDKFTIPNTFELNGALYAFSMNEEVASRGNFDKIIFSSGNDSQNIINQTQTTDIVDRSIYKVTGGSGTLQEVTTSNFDINVVTDIQFFTQDLKNKNPQLNESTISNLEKVTLTLQKILANSYDYNLSNDLLIPLQEINNYLSKDEGQYEELNKKIEEANNILNNPENKQENISKLEQNLKDAENIKDNYDYFTKDQVNDIIKILDEEIEKLLPDTSKLEEILEKAKNIDISKYTDETAKLLSDAIAKTEDALKGNLTTSKITELTTALNDAISKLLEKNITNEDKNPATGDILYIIIPVLVIATLAILFTIVYSKKKNKSESK